MMTYTRPLNTGIQISGTGMRRNLLRGTPPTSGCSPDGKIIEHRVDRSPTVYAALVANPDGIGLISGKTGSPYSLFNARQNRR
jgi:hypothetical protein